MKRSEVEDKYKWNLEDLFATTESWEIEFQDLKERLHEFNAFRDTFSNSCNSLFQCLELEEELSLSLERLYVYAAMKRDEDTTLAVNQALLEKASTLASQLSQSSSFIVPEILELNQDKIMSYYREMPILLKFKRSLDSILRSKNHILSSEKEELLAHLGEVTSAPSTIYNMINNADIAFPSIKNENNELIHLTKGNFSDFLQSANREVRKNVYKALYSSYIKQKNTIAATLYANIKKNNFYSHIRNYKSTLEKSLFADDVSENVYNNLIDTVKMNLKPLHKYLNLRKRLLGLEQLHSYDLHVPLVQESNIKISYEEAYATMIKGLSPLGDEYIKGLETAFNDGWIDVRENEGKRSGAYSWGAYGTHPYVLLNHSDNLSSMFTLAHEMGHAMHSYFSDSENGYLDASYTIFVAEVASTVNEVLLMHYLLQETKDVETKKYLINYFLEQYRGTIFRQTMFAEFEKTTHALAQDGIPLTVDVFSELYKNLNDEYYGGLVETDEEVKYEWMRIPHFYNAFYVYKYATGFSAAIAIANNILKEETNAVDNYLSFLKSGGTNFPIELLKTAGIDMSSPQPIEDALLYFGTLVDDLENLYNKETYKKHTE